MVKPFKTDLLLRLVIPPTLARRYLFSLHFSKSLHVSSTQLLGIFNQIFFCFQQTALAKKITDDCLICSFYKFPYRKDTKGSSKFQHENYRPWTHLSMDIAVLIPDRYKKRFAIILVDEASSYTMLFSLKDTLSSTIANVFLSLFGTISPPKTITCDFAPSFQKLATFFMAFGTSLRGSLARRSRQQSQSEVTIKFTKALLTKLINENGN